MTDDLSVFWRNNARAYELFRDLLARAERNAFDDDFLTVLAAYREAAPASERADICAALYLLACGDAENAALCGERAFQKRPLNFAVWHVLSTAYCIQCARTRTRCAHNPGIYPAESPAGYVLPHPSEGLSA